MFEFQVQEVLLVGLIRKRDRQGMLKYLGSGEIIVFQLAFPENIPLLLQGGINQVISHMIQREHRKQQYGSSFAQD